VILSTLRVRNHRHMWTEWRVGYMHPDVVPRDKVYIVDPHLAGSPVYRVIL